MVKSLTKKNLGGAPTKLTEEAVQKLESIFQVGGTVEEATSYAGIARRTYHYWMEKNDDFARKMEAAQHYSDVVAKNVVVASITKNKDLDTSKWWLEKRQFKNNITTNVQVNVKPLLGGESQTNVPSNNSDQETIEIIQEN